MVQIIRPADRDTSTIQTEGMLREAGVCSERTDAKGLWMGIGHNEPGAQSGAHHHGESESAIYVLSGQLRFRWGANLEHVADAQEGDFIFVPPYEVHLEENVSAGETAAFIVARNTAEAIVVNVDTPA